MWGRSLCLHLPDRCLDVICPSGGTEATAFGGTSSDVAVKENMVMLNKVESGGIIKQYEKRDVWVCVVSEGRVALALAAVAVGHRKGVLTSYRSLLF